MLKKVIPVIVYLVAVFFLLASVTACKKNIPVADTLVYSGKLGGNYISSDELVSIFEEVRACMHADPSLPYPDIHVYSGGEHVICNGDISYSCFSDGKVIIPQEVYVFALKDAFIHYILWKQTGDSDDNHTSPYFWKCSNLSLVEGEMQ